MKALITNELFTPIQVGSIELKHRLVMAPLTRSRSVQPGSIPGELMLEYYSQRASDGGLIVSEGDFDFDRRRGDGSEPPACIRTSRLRGGRESRTPFMGRVGTCSPNSGIPGVPHMWTRRTAQLLSALRSTRSIGAERAKSAGFDGVELHAGNSRTVDNPKVASREVAPPPRKVPARAHQNAAQPRVHRISRTARDGIKTHCRRVFSNPTRKDAPHSAQRHVPLGETKPRASLCRSASSTSAPERLSEREVSVQKENDMNIESNSILITGANRGIGRVPVEEALRRGARRVYAGTRQSPRTN